jgi:hypothetical protein
MKTNIVRENNAIANELGIPRFAINAKQKNYYSYHLRRCTRYLEWISIANIILILVILFVFFTRGDEVYYLTSFSGTNTQITPMTLDQANYVTQQKKT